MNITKFINYSDKQTVNKSLSALGVDSTVQYKGECDILNPVLILKDFPANCNYIYIADLNRYYYVKSFSVMGSIYIVNLEIDVLMSYRASINSLECLVTRQEFEVAEDIVDGEILPDCTVEISNNLIGQCGDSFYHYYLAAIGL